MSIWPLVPAGTTAALVVQPVGLPTMVETSGIVVPVGYAVRKASWVIGRNWMFSEYAPAVDGRPGQSVLAGTLNVLASSSAKLGWWKPSEIGWRVSTMRQGAMATKGRGEDGSASARALIPCARASMPPPTPRSACGAAAGVQYGGAPQLDSGRSSSCAMATPPRHTIITATTTVRRSSIATSSQVVKAAGGATCVCPIRPRAVLGLS